MDRFVKKQLESLFICCKLTRRIMNFQNQPIHKVMSPLYEEYDPYVYFMVNRFTMPFDVYDHKYLMIKMIFFILSRRTSLQDHGTRALK